jgi:uncharacterized membrane protein (DUF485 family)
VLTALLVIALAWFLLAWLVLSVYVVIARVRFCRALIRWLKAVPW